MDFSSVEQEINNAPAPHILPKGTEAELRIIKVNEGVSDKNNARWFMPAFDIPADPVAKELNAFFWNPLDNNKLDEKQRQKNNYQLQQFIKCFNLDPKGFDFDAIVNKKGWVILGIQQDSEYGDKNSINKYVVPQSGNSAPAESAY